MTAHPKAVSSSSPALRARASRRWLSNSWNGALDWNQVSRPRPVRHGRAKWMGVTTIFSVATRLNAAAQPESSWNAPRFFTEVLGTEHFRTRWPLDLRQANG